MILEGGHWIDGAWSREGETTFSAVDPRNGRSLEGVFYAATDAEIAAAGRAAISAHRTWRRVDRSARSRLLFAIADAIEEHRAPIIERAQAETGLPEGRLVAETQRTTNQLRLFGELAQSGDHLDARIDYGDAGRQPLPKPDLRFLRVPLGPVAVFGASNFPLAFSVAGGDTAAALAAGCPVIVRAHPSHPGTSELVGRAITEAVASIGAHPGLFSLIQGADHAVGAALVREPMVKALAFTGSFRGGRALMEIAAQRPEPIPVYAEMGSLNPIFALPHFLEADVEGFARDLAASVSLGVGQFCTNPGVVVCLAGSATEALAGHLTRDLQAVGEATMLNRGIADAYQQRHSELQGAGAEVLLNTDQSSKVGSQASCGLLRVPASAFMTNETLQDECFGPTTMLVVCEDVEELLALAESLPGQLTTTLRCLGDDQELAERLQPSLEECSGRLLYEGFPTGVEVTAAMVHGGPWPASSAAGTTSVGTAAIERFLRPRCWQDAPDALLPLELRDGNPTQLRRKEAGRPRQD